MMFVTALKRHLKLGTIDVVGPTGALHTARATPTPHLRIRIKKPGLGWKLLLAPSFFLPEGYVDGDIEIEKGDLSQLLTVLLSSVPDNVMPSALEKSQKVLEPLVDWLSGVGSPRHSARDVPFHYDLSNDFFKMFLDPNMQYSCAYFEHSDETLAEAQLSKMRHLASKLLLSREHRVLDIGSGWGALAGFLNKSYGVDVQGVTLSQKQCTLANEVWGSEQVSFAVRDYRTETARYDRIVSVGMLEHVGSSHYDEYFSKVASLLADDGVALVHTIGRRGPPMSINLWIRKRIFPGAYLPSLSQLASAVERAGLWMLDCENLRLHYAKTLHCWHDALKARRKDIEDQYGARFYRAWEFYLVSCEIGFLHQGLTVYQLLLGKRPDAAPLTRTFMYEEEARLKLQATRNRGDALGKVG